MCAIIKCSAIILVLAAVTPSNAKGCLKAHFMVHRGAAAGCIIHEAKKRAQMGWSGKRVSIRPRAMVKSDSSAFPHGDNDDPPSSAKVPAPVTERAGHAILQIRRR